MGRARALIIAGAIGALAVTAIGAPVAAADTQGTLAIVNGIPGKRVDVCINGNELRSDLPYGGVFLRNVISTGNKNLKFYERDPRTCRGNVLAQKNVALAAGGDLTIVATKNAPKVVVFDNVGAGEIRRPDRPSASRSSSGAMRPRCPPTSSTGSGRPIPRPRSARAWTRCGRRATRSASLVGNDTILQLRATRPEDPDTLAVKRADIRLDRRYEWILVGSNAGNVKFVLFSRAISGASP